MNINSLNQQQFISVVAKNIQKPISDIGKDTFTFTSGVGISASKLLELYKKTGDLNKAVDTVFEQASQSGSSVDEGKLMVLSGNVELYNSVALLGTGHILSKINNIIFNPYCYAPNGVERIPSGAEKIDENIIAVDFNVVKDKEFEQKTDLMENKPSYRVYIGVEEGNMNGFVYANNLEVKGVKG